LGGAANRPHQLGGGAVSSHSGVRDGAPATEGFSCILFRKIAFHGTSVLAAYGLWCTNTWFVLLTVI